MSESNYWQRVSMPNLNRRAFLRSTALSGAGAAAFLAGCRSTSTNQPATGGAAGGATAAQTAIFAVPEAKRGGTLTDSASEPTTGWDPHATIGTNTITATDPMHLKLIRHDYRKTPPWKSGAEELMIGELAEKWESPDKLTYNFTLRKGLNWPNQDPANGRPVTAQDVKYSFDHAKLPTSTIQESIFNPIASVAAIDDYTIQFKLSQPNWGFLNLLDSYNAVVIPKGVFEWAGADGMKSAERARGGGPWLLQDYQPGSVIRYVPNEAYRKVFGVPYADKLNLAVLASGAPILQAFIGKQTQFMQVKQGQLVPGKAGRPDAKLREDSFGPASDTAIYFKTTEAPFNDVRLRRAMSMAVDRDGWGKTLEFQYKWENGPVSWGFPQWKLDPKTMPADTAAYLQYNVAEAKKLVLASGLSASTEFPLAMYPYDATYVPNGQFITDSFAKIGINAKTKVYDYNNWLATAYTKPPSGMMYSPDTIDRVSSQLLERLSKGSGRNHSDISDDATQKLLSDYQTAPSPAEAKVASDAIQIRSVDQAFAVYRPAVPVPLFWDPAVQNYDGQVAISYTKNWRAAFLWLA